MSSADIFNYAVGVLAIASAVMSIALYSRSYLPGAQIKVLEEILEDTRKIYQKAEADRALPSGRRGSSVKSAMMKLESISNNLKVQAYDATSPYEEYKAMLRGLSGQIMHLTRKTKKFRHYLMTASEEERRLQRRARMSLGCRSTIAPSIATPLPRCASDPATVSEGVEVIERAASCSPVLPSEQPDIVPQFEEVPALSNLDVASQLNSIDVLLDEECNDGVSRSSTLVDQSSERWVSIGLPFTNLRWCFEFSGKGSSNSKGPQASGSSPTPDITSLPV